MTARIVFILCVFLAVTAPAMTHAQSCGSSGNWALVLHGGYLDYEEEVTPAHRQLFAQLLAQGKASLAAGGTALDAVSAAIRAMEDSGLLDAGKGSIVNTEGFTETDASIMDGATGRSGAVAAMQRVRNPILAARMVMDRTKHVLLVGATGEQSLRALGAEMIDPSAWYQEFVPPPKPVARKHGTVGAAALDRCGHLAAGTSTGGWPGKLPGRVGDSPIIGASTYADTRVALSATGVGEYFIKRAATRDIALRVQYLGQPLKAAADHVVKTLIGGEDKAEGAVIALGSDGEVVINSNGYGILWGLVRSDRDALTGSREPPAPTPAITTR
jgi:L-asparaginase / beta-aspartyl-peptidase